MCRVRARPRAEWATFRFYSDGVFTDPRCRTKANELDHAVVLVGYGTTEDGARIASAGWSPGRACASGRDGVLP